MDNLQKLFNCKENIKSTAISLHDVIHTATQHSTLDFVKQLDSQHAQKEEFDQEWIRSELNKLTGSRTATIKRKSGYKQLVDVTATPVQFMLNIKNTFIGKFQILLHILSLIWVMMYPILIIMIIFTAIKRRNKEKRKKNTEKNHQIKK